MSHDTATKVIQSISEHVEEKHLNNIKIILHGGEPLLQSEEFFRYFSSQVKTLIPDFCEASISMQSNGVLLTESLADILLNLNIGIGISIDGNKSDNDKFRLYHSGKSSFKDTYKAIKILSNKKYDSIFGGLLCVINIDNQPLETFHFLSGLSNSVDFLLPHYNHKRKPPYLKTPLGYGYGKWLCDIFDEWLITTNNCRIRIFDEIIHLLIGGTYTYEALGLAPVELIAIQTDGAFEAVDSLKSTFDGAVFTGLNVFDNKLSEVLHLSAVKSRIEKFDNLSQTCKECNLSFVCGGGYIPHRYDEDNFFNNTSVYCDDLKLIINHIRMRLYESGENKIIDLLQQTKIKFESN